MYSPKTIPDSKVSGVNIGSIWGRQDPGGPHVGTMNFVIWAPFSSIEFPVSVHMRQKYFDSMYWGLLQCFLKLSASGWSFSNVVYDQKHC